MKEQIEERVSVVEQQTWLQSFFCERANRRESFRRATTTFEDMTTHHQKGSSAGNANSLSERAGSESCQNYTRFEEKHQTTGDFPSQMLIGRDLHPPSDLLFDCPTDAPPLPEEYVQDLQARFAVILNFARERVNLTTEKMKTRYDNRATEHHFNGDKVWLWNTTR
ncbi:hypothetical protein X975_20912, partial [Stegodyphus mimosarum]